MRVKMLKERREEISPLRSRVYRRDLIVDIDDDVAAGWIAEGAAVAVDAPDAPVQLTAAETAVLKVAAGQILAQTGELLAADADDNGEAAEADDIGVSEAVVAPPAPRTRKGR
jgi:hypothetical protein